MTVGHLSSRFNKSVRLHNFRNEIKPKQPSLDFFRRETFEMFAMLKNSSQIRNLVADAFHQQLRHLNLQEHVSQTLLNNHGIATPCFGNAKTADDAEKIARDLLTKNLIVKAQVMAGGRGLGKFKSGLKSGVHSASR